MCICTDENDHTIIRVYCIGMYTAKLVNHSCRIQVHSHHIKTGILSMFCPLLNCYRFLSGIEALCSRFVNKMSKGT